MNQNTKEQKAFAACKELITCADKFDISVFNSAVALARVATAPDVSKAALNCWSSWCFKAPEQQTLETFARIIDEETKHVELRAALGALWQESTEISAATLTRVKSILEATKCTP